MANIQIAQLLPAGYDLFNDTTSFVNDLANQDLQTIVGGGHHSCWDRSHYERSHSHHYSHKDYSYDWGKKGKYWY
ncbi:hypothetical protein B6N60_02592 [Richelia sinica FACHB-800]|uniref:Uncharacterized protein n=1 Tax=Richelia sinica FACHB-800 TaxID=1357546 RepID=A0A975Y560_9NOST|nr:hypothetical protein [Richelia sinica]MBD2666282.1 hypothetical protein [Richelia sinica FACHB-800]QXE23895.1 hypothetical protein B6N60_02592 [Richelia sinica FACHB-800]